MYDPIEQSILCYFRFHIWDRHCNRKRICDHCGRKHVLMTYELPAFGPPNTKHVISRWVTVND